VQCKFTHIPVKGTAPGLFLSEGFGLEERGSKSLLVAKISSLGFSVQKRNLRLRTVLEIKVHHQTLSNHILKLSG